MRDLFEALQHVDRAGGVTACAHEDTEAGFGAGIIGHGRAGEAAQLQAIPEGAQGIVVANQDDRISGLGRLVEPVGIDQGDGVFSIHNAIRWRAAFWKEVKLLVTNISGCVASSARES